MCEHENNSISLWAMSVVLFMLSVCLYFLLSAGLAHAVSVEVNGQGGSVRIQPDGTVTAPAALPSGLILPNDDVSISNASCVLIEGVTARSIQVQALPSPDAADEKQRRCTL